MNWKRGLFRLWLIFAVVWVAPIAYFHLTDGLLPHWTHQPAQSLITIGLTFRQSVIE